MGIHDSSGRPKVYRGTIDPAAAPPTPQYEHIRFPKLSKRLDIRNDGPNEIRLWFAQADFDAGTNYVRVAPFADRSLSPETEQVFMRAQVGPASYELIYYASF